MDTDSTSFDALTIQAAIARAEELAVQFIGGGAGVATLTSAVWGRVWTRRYKMSGPPRAN